MARTWKDEPLHVKLKRNMERGLIDHDHSRLHMAESERWRRARDLSLTFYKWASREIYAHEQYLIALGDAVRYTKTEIPGQRSVRFHGQGPSFSVEYTEKTVKFQVERRWLTPRNDLCTTPEAYDSRSHCDERNGLRANCTPIWTRDLPSYGSRVHNRISRAATRDALTAARRLANAGELDDYYDDPAAELLYGKKTWDPWD